MIKHAYNFYKYFDDEEKDGGDYWNYLDITLDDEEKLSLNLHHFDIYNNIIKNIKNSDLKGKMTDKLKELILNSLELHYDDVRIIFELFSSDELIRIIEDKVKKFDKKNTNASNLFELVMRCKSVPLEWKVSQITNILERIDDIDQLIIYINYFRENDKVYYQVIKNMKDKLPKLFFKYLDVISNPEYIREKEEKYAKDDIRVGIDPRILIGVEIEANGRYPFGDFLDTQVLDGFKQSLDPTVPDGIEISTTEELHDTRSEMASLKAVCDTMSELGYYYNDEYGNASGQINLGLDYLDSAPAILNFYEIFGNCEELLWYISNASGQIARQNIYTNSRMKAISEIIGKRVLDEDISRDDAILLFNSRITNDSEIDGLKYKKNSVCLRGTDDSDYRFEIRIPNGGCNFETWVDNIRLYGKMMEVSKRLADIMIKKDDFTKEDEKLLGLKIELLNNKLSLEEKLDILMDLLFDDEEIKDIYYDRYEKTKEMIIKTGTSNYRKVTFNGEPAFGKVEFQGQYGKDCNQADIYMGNVVVSYDPETGWYSSDKPKGRR